MIKAKSQNTNWLDLASFGPKPPAENEISEIIYLASDFGPNDRLPSWSRTDPGLQYLHPHCFRARKYFLKRSH